VRWLRGPQKKPLEHRLKGKKAQGLRSIGGGGFGVGCVGFGRGGGFVWGFGVWGLEGFWGFIGGWWFGLVVCGTGLKVPNLYGHSPQRTIPPG